MITAHVGGLPLEELVPLAGGGAGLLAVRTWIIARMRRRRESRRTP